MTKRIKSPYLILIVVQALLVIIAFKDFRIRPSEIIFSNEGDGLKNYFTLLTYVKQPAEKGYFNFSSFNYPFGESIYTTDNTPFFAIPFRWFCLNIVDVSDHTIAVYNYFIILNIVLSTLLCFAIFRRLLKNDVWSLVLSLVFAWTNIQTQRIWRGHFNLSISTLILLAIWLAILWIEQKDKKGRYAGIAVAMILLNYFGFLIHGYYLAIIGIFQSALIFSYGLYRVRTGVGKVSIAASIVIPAVSAFLCLGTLRLTDRFYTLRSPGSHGYDWMEHKIRFWGFFTHYDIHSVFFPLKNLQGSHDAENRGYLGNVGLYTLLFLIILAVASRANRSRILDIQRSFFSSKLFGPIFFGSLLMLIISFGEIYVTKENGVILYNFLNPLYLLHQFTDMVEQFRSMGRFAWPFFWGFNIWMIYSLYHLYPHLSKKFHYGIIIGLVFFGGVEVKNYVDSMQGRASQQNHLNYAFFPEFAKLKINPAEYQALLQLPYYAAGSESFDYVIDDYDPESRYSYQLSLFTGLPLINVKLSRTVTQQVALISKLIAEDSLRLDMAKKFNDKPVLVFRHKEIARDSDLHVIPGNGLARETYWKAMSLPERRRLKKVDSLGDVIFYKWYPKTFN